MKLFYLQLEQNKHSVNKRILIFTIICFKWLTRQQHRASKSQSYPHGQLASILYIIHQERYWSKNGMLEFPIILWFSENIFFKCFKYQPQANSTELNVIRRKYLNVVNICHYCKRLRASLHCRTCDSEARVLESRRGAIISVMTPAAAHRGQDTGKSLMSIMLRDRVFLKQ